MPKVKNTLADEANGTLYHVMAYRVLTRDEMAAAVNEYYARRKGHRRNREKGKEVTVVTSVGYGE